MSTSEHEYFLDMTYDQHQSEPGHDNGFEIRTICAYRDESYGRGVGPDVVFETHAYCDMDDPNKPKNLKGAFFGPMNKESFDVLRSLISQCGELPFVPYAPTMSDLQVSDPSPQTHEAEELDRWIEKTYQRAISD